MAYWLSLMSWGGGGGVLANPYAVELFADNFYPFKTEIADAISSFK